MPFPTTLDRIEEAERQLGRRLPDAVRRRLLNENGGEVEAGDEVWLLFPVFDASDRKRAARSAAHIVHENAGARQWPGFPAEAIAIATDGAGNYLVVLAGTNECARWEHETGDVTPVSVAWHPERPS